MQILTIAIAKINKLALSIILAFAFILLSSMSLSAHDLGISAINLEILDGKLVVSSSYARADFGEMIFQNSAEDLKAFTKKAVAIEVDGKVLEFLDNEVSTDNGDGLILRHTFGEVSGSKIKITSFLPSKLSENHTQILKLIRNDKEISRQFLTGDNNQFVFDLDDLQTPTSFWQFLKLGIEHIVFGYDHLLFLFALLLVVKSFGEIAKIVTSFTVAHSITLSLATLNVIQISTSLIEPLIALSIIFVGLENLFKKEQKNRWLVTYVFGLIHGFGFAFMLQEIGIGKGYAVIRPLLSFNLGVEIGQIAVVLLVLPILWYLQKKEFYSNRLVPIGSGLVVLAGLYWLIERTLF